MKVVDTITVRTSNRRDCVDTTSLFDFKFSHRGGLLPAYRMRPKPIPTTFLVILVLNEVAFNAEKVSDKTNWQM